MEFFAYARRKTTSEVLKERLTIASLPQFCASIDKVLEDNGDTGRIYCVWGEFPVDRQTISGGVRFTLPSCPNACAWTITTGHPPDPETVAVHCTINRPDHDPDFIETLEDFVADWKTGLEAHLVEG